MDQRIIDIIQDLLRGTTSRRAAIEGIARIVGELRGRPGDLYSGDAQKIFDAYVRGEIQGDGYETFSPTSGWSAISRSAMPGALPPVVAPLAEGIDPAGVTAETESEYYGAGALPSTTTRGEATSWADVPEAHLRESFLDPSLITDQRVSTPTQDLLTAAAENPLLGYEAQMNPYAAFMERENMDTGPLTPYLPPVGTGTGTGTGTGNGVTDPRLILDPVTGLQGVFNPSMGAATQGLIGARGVPTVDERMYGRATPESPLSQWAVEEEFLAGLSPEQQWTNYMFSQPWAENARLRQAAAGLSPNIRRAFDLFFPFGEAPPGGETWPGAYSEREGVQTPRDYGGFLSGALGRPSAGQITDMLNLAANLVKTPDPFLESSPLGMYGGAGAGRNWMLRKQLMDEPARQLQPLLLAATQGWGPRARQNIENMYTDIYGRFQAANPLGNFLDYAQRRNLAGAFRPEEYGQPGFNVENLWGV